jgi:uncharacterized protein (TIGR00297 family)
LTQRDLLGLALSYAYAFGLLFGVEAIGRQRKWPQFVTRKLVHIGAGMWIWGILALFDTRLYGLIPFATFIVLNYVFYRYQLFKAMDATDSSPGTVYFAIAITLLFGLFWHPAGPDDRVVIAAAAVMAMTWGDGVASLIGKRHGRSTYTTFGHQRTWEGTMAMIACAFLSMLVTLWVLPGSTLSPNSIPIPPELAVILAIAGTIVATTAESLSPAGTDNLSVPLLSGLVLYLLTRYTHGAGTLTLLQLGLGIAFSVIIAVVAYRREALSASGAVGAVLVGTTIFGFGGWPWGMLLIAFFVLSSLLSSYKEGIKQSLSEKFAKGSRRDLGQVLANGGLGALLAIAYAAFDHPLLLFAFTGAMATVNADTWATELGVLNRKPPRLITTGEVVEPGTSGGISAVGTVATSVGGLVIGLLAALSNGLDAAALSGGMGAALIAAGLLGGISGSLVDSLLGATIQAIYYTESRQKETEKPIDPDGTPNTRIRGWPWLNNDWVNFISSMAGALAATVIAWLMIA